ncbi:Galactose mutarotase-like superfamily protein [Rhynchospora pubera]|uniref:glucose-6-phosphate 1-epimerase n=1 Tax=Rhynchospora pubera TaxID=906938 RepID=A0AAV8BP87_9POAL|nr:Galactose mutarotase-like superfamily protein [Rhynchospora pubera]
MEAQAVEREGGMNGLEKLVLREGGWSAEVYLYGAHVTSWKSSQGEELLFLSSKALFEPPKAIRGTAAASPSASRSSPTSAPFLPTASPATASGPSTPIPNSTPLPTPLQPSSISFFLLLLLLLTTISKPIPTGASITSNSYLSFFFSLPLPNFFSSFEYRLRVQLGPAGLLTLTSRVRNTNSDGKPFSFTFAYHTYFSVSDISEVRVEGLETLDYLDNLQDRSRFTEQGDAITFEGELDRIYLEAPRKIAILDHEKNRTFVVIKDGLPDAVVWNPWDKKAKAMSDFGDEEYKHMVCVEAAAIEDPVTLKPTEEWTGRLQLSLVPNTHVGGSLDVPNAL